VFLAHSQGPHGAQQLMVGDHLAGVGDKDAEEIVLGRGQLRFLTRDSDDAPRQIHRQVPVVKIGESADGAIRRMATRMRASSSPMLKGLVR